MAWDDPIRDPAEQRGFHLIGRTIRRKRVWLGLSQRQLEGLSGIDQTVISRIETGKQYGVRWVRFARLVDALDGLETPTLESAARSPRYERMAMPPPVIDLDDPARDDDPPGDDLLRPLRPDAAIGIASNARRAAVMPPLASTGEPGRAGRNQASNAFV